MKKQKTRLIYWLPVLAISTIGVLVWAGVAESGHVSGLADIYVSSTDVSETNASPLANANDEPPQPYGDMVRLPTGTFILGLTDEDVYGRTNAGRVVLAMTNSYFDRFEVTNREYLEFVQEQNDRSLLPDVEAWGGDREAMVSYLTQSQFQDHPVLGVTWENAKRFCDWNGGRRLPTEAEWEYAARAGQIGAVYPWRGFRATDPSGRYLANFSPEGNPAATGYSRTAPVGAFPPNRWGIHDVAGNAAEWVEDSYSRTYDHYETGDSDPAPFIDEQEDERIIRGGSWRSNSFEIGVGVRDSQPQNQGSQEIGFRCAANVTRVEGDAGATDIFDSMPEQSNEPEEERGEEERGEEERGEEEIELPSIEAETSESEGETSETGEEPPLEK